MTRVGLNRLLTVWVGVQLITSLACSGLPAGEDHLAWVGTWATAPMAAEVRDMPPVPPGLAGSTLRQIVHVSIGGTELRVRFSNAFGRTPLTIVAAHIARSVEGGAIDPETDTPLTFGRMASITVPAGALVVSDPVKFRLAPLSDLAVTIYAQQVPEVITVHPASHCTSFLQAGDQVAAPELPDAIPTEHWYMLNGVDVRAPASAAAVAALGDSITDGSGSKSNVNQRWPDYLARRLQKDSTTEQVGVLNLGIGGNRILNDGRGPNALARLDRDVLAQSGVRWLILFEGINDIGTYGGEDANPGQVPATAENLIAAFEQIIDRAHSQGIRVYGATILPMQGSFYFTPEKEVERQKVNQWIRTSGEFDAVLDFDAATRDPQRPTFLSANVDSGDHIHLSGTGYGVLADSIDLGLFGSRPRGSEAPAVE